MKKDLFLLYTCVIGLGISIFMYFTYLGYKYNNNIAYHDPLNKKLVDMPFISKNCCSMWPITHFIAFAIFGYIWPQYAWTLFVLGICWESIEPNFEFLARFGGHNGVQIEAKSDLLALFFPSLSFDRFLERF